MTAARETNLLRIERYKRVYDAKVRSRNEVLPGESVLVKKFLWEPGRSPKLSFPVAGPYPVLTVDGVQAVLKTRDGDQRVHLDRVIRCPMDLPPGVQFAQAERAGPSLANADWADIEYIVDRLVSHARDEEGTGFLIRVRWAGYDKGSDTWEPAENLPEKMLRSYERSKKLQEGTLTRSIEPPPPGLMRYGRRS
mgnify:FL=1